MCWQPAAGTNKPKDELSSDGRVKRLYLRHNILDKYGRATGCPGCIGIGPHTKDCRARIEQEMLAKGDAIKLETRQKCERSLREPETSPKKRKTGESDVNPGGALSLTADTPKREGSEHASNVESSTVLCDMPSVDLSHDRTAPTGKFPQDALKAGREIELGKMLNFDAFRSRLCVRQFRAEGLRTICLLYAPDTFSSNISWPKLRVAKTSESLSWTSLLRSRTLGQMRKFM